MSEAKDTLFRYTYNYSLIALFTHPVQKNCGSMERKMLQVKFTHELILFIRFLLFLGSHIIQSNASQSEEILHTTYRFLFSNKGKKQPQYILIKIINKHLQKLAEK
jgi:hypothetical protein